MQIARTQWHRSTQNTDHPRSKLLLPNSNIQVSKFDKVNKREGRKIKEKGGKGETKV